MSGGWRRRLTRNLKLALLAVAGLMSVSIPVTIALMLSATGSSDRLTLGTGAATPATVHPRPEPARAPRCVARQGYYALTFDGGPSPSATRRLVAALRHAGAVATFFDVGSLAAAHPELVRAQRTAGQVANYGFTPVRLTDVSPARRLQELQATARTLGYPNGFARPPWGATNADVDADLRRSGLTPVLWTVDAAAATSVRPGGIVRLSERADVVPTVPGLIRTLREQGLCPGRLAPTSRSVRAPDGTVFHVTAVAP